MDRQMDDLEIRQLLSFKRSFCGLCSQEQDGIASQNILNIQNFVLSLREIIKRRTKRIRYAPK